MHRAIEVAVIDGERGFGNGLLMPAGPLREPVRRLAAVDYIVVNGSRLDLAQPQYLMETVPVRFRKVLGEESLAPEEFCQRHPWVRGICGIGNPGRFFRTLASTGLSVERYVMPDHHPYSGEEMDFSAQLPVVCTEKDAIKLARLDIDLSQVWYLQVAVNVEPEFLSSLKEKLAALTIVPAGQVSGES